MSIEKNMNARIQHKHDIEANWNKALNFIPKIGEIIIYDIDENHNYERIKIGDGIQTVNNLDFLLDSKYISSDKADAIKKASGEIVSLTNSVHTPLYGFKLYGKTTQNGTPTPEIPVELVSAGDDGSVEVSVRGKNLFNIDSVTFLIPSWLGNDSASRVEGDIIINDVGSYGDRIYAASDLEYLPKGTYVLSMDVKSETEDICYVGFKTNAREDYVKKNLTGLNEWTKISYSFTLQTDDIVKGFIFQGGGSASNYRTLNTQFKNIQLEIGSIATEYEPYKTPETLTVSTPNGLAGIPVTSGGNYTDSNGQQWICDEVDFARGVYVQRVGRINSYAGEEVATAYMSSTGELSDGATVLYALATPIEAPLSAEQLQAYASLHTNEPNTTIMNDGNAGIEVKYYTPSTAVQMVHSPLDEGKILSIDEHGCVVLSELDAGSIDIDLDGTNNGEINSINADTLGGVPANNYVLKDELEGLMPDGSNNSSVLYIQQDLTEAQQAQVRENIGIDTYITAYIEEVLLGGEW